MGNGLESFALLEKRTLELGRRYQEVLDERNSLRLKVERQAQKLSELESKVGGQEDLLSAVDAKMVDLLGQIDNFLPQEQEQESESKGSGNIQVLPGMHGS
jgi:chromosome segregation ATPase